MRRLARRLFTLCSALSLLLCVAVCVLWVWSYWQRYDLRHTAPERHRTLLMCDDGRPRPVVVRNTVVSRLGLPFAAEKTLIIREGQAL